MKIQYLDKDGWPVTLTRGRIIINALRLILHTKMIRFGEFVQNAMGCGSLTDTAGPAIREENKELRNGNAVSSNGSSASEF